MLRKAATVSESIIKDNKIELLFLNIRFNDGLRTELLEHIQNPSFPVIFITAFDQYVVQTFKYSAIY